jgi:hypothetical protein
VSCGTLAGVGNRFSPVQKKSFISLPVIPEKKQSIFTFSYNCLFIITFPNIGKLYFGFAMEFAAEHLRVGGGQ